MDNFAFLLPVTMTLFGVAFLALGWLGQKTAYCWGIAFLAGAAGFVAPILPLPTKLQSFFGNAAFLISFFYYGEALLRLFKAPRLVVPRLVFALFAYGAILVAVEGLESLHLELTLSDLSVALLLAVPLGMVFGRTRNPADKVLVAVASIVVLDIVIRLFVFNVLVGVSDDLAAFAGSSYTYFSQISVSVLSVTFALSALGSLIYGLLDGYRQAAERDPLTGLFNRRGFDKVAEASRRGSAPLGVVLTCDIDHFKAINDRFGHASGDLVLSGLADLLLSILPTDAVVARFGGEEFVAFLPASALPTATTLAHGLRTELSGRDWRPSGVEGVVTLCSGVAAVSASDRSLHDALARADRALYAAKAGGRNQVMIDAGEAYVPGLRIVPTEPGASAL